MSEKKEKPKRKQKPKKGKVVRLSPQTWKVVEGKRRQDETVDQVVRRLAGLSGDSDTKTYFILPESKIVLDGVRTLAEAKGAAVLVAVRKRREKPETPIAVRPVIAG